MTKTIAIYVSTATDTQPPTFNTPDNALGYADLFRFIIKHGGQPIITYDADSTYLGNSRFNQYWIAELANDQISYKKIDSEITVDLLYDKNRFPYSDLKKLNPDKIKQICNDKYSSYLLSPDMSSTSFLINTPEQLDTLRATYSQQRIVIKELDGLGGEKVFIGNLANYHNNFNYPLIFQEFIDTSSGLPDLANGIHDLRIALFNGQPIHGLLRYPTNPDELRTNLYLGGKVQALFINQIPTDAIKLAQEIDRRFQTDSPRFFAADFGFDGQNWKLFELNNMPGIWSKRLYGDANDEYLELLAKNLVSSA
ncbi:ATP-grasp domain-containing protein [Candidatus Saccharibacteria bacterium]|nr:ATP-grasp domain-containing protein [Candidatus Saccharibacteria bacterium]